MTIFITGLHIALCFFLILVVLLQPGKGADFGAAMGGSSQNMNQATGPAGVLGKVTAVVAAMFMVTSMLLAYFSNQPERSDLDLESMEQELLGDEAAPAGEAPPAAEEPAPAADEPEAGEADEPEAAPEGDESGEEEAPEADESGEDEGGE